MGMKESTIKMVIRNKMKGLLESIPDGDIRTTIEQNAIITGGCISSMLLGEKVNDFDVYFKTLDATKQVAAYYIHKFNETKGQLKAKAYASCNPQLRLEKRTNIKGEEEDRVIIYIKSAGVAGENQDTYQYFESRPEEEGDSFAQSLIDDDEKLETSEELVEDLRKKESKFRPLFFSENAITLSDKMQLITRFHGDVENIHKNFDFVHCTCSYDYLNRKMVLPSDALQALLSKTLIYRGSLYPLCSMFRIRKFVKREWRITAGQMLKIAHQLSNIDLNDMKVLQEQLVGVDAAYMHELITELNKVKGQRIDATYLAKIIDEIFE